MNCSNCGKPIDQNIKFCGFCGAKVIPKEEVIVTQINSGKEIKIALNKSLLFTVALIGIAVVVIYIITTDKPFVSTSQQEQKKIDQNLITSSVVNILCQSGDEAGSGGSGTIITTEGAIITNSHVIPQDEKNLLTPEEGCLVILPNQQNGQPEEMYWATPVVIPGVSDDYDLAYLTIYDAYRDDNGVKKGVYPKIFPSIFAETEKYDQTCVNKKPKLGDAIRIFGYPQTSGGFNLTVTEGVVSSIPDDNTILTSAKVDEGNSGGLAVDSSGCMVGIPVAVSQGTYQNLGVIISTAAVLEFSDKMSKINNQ